MSEAQRTKADSGLYLGWRARRFLYCRVVFQGKVLCACEQHLSSPGLQIFVALTTDEDDDSDENGGDDDTHDDQGHSAGLVLKGTVVSRAL